MSRQTALLQKNLGAYFKSGTHAEALSAQWTLFNSHTIANNPSIANNRPTVKCENGFRSNIWTEWIDDEAELSGSDSGDESEEQEVSEDEEGIEEEEGMNAREMFNSMGQSQRNTNCNRFRSFMNGLEKAEKRLKAARKAKKRARLCNPEIPS